MPNYFDILVMYMVILALMPVIVGLSWIGPRVAMGFSVALWALVSQPWLALIDVPVFTGLNLPAEPVGQDRTWFFNPFCWQLVFFTGFASSAGWLPKPPVKASLILLAIAILLIGFPLDPDGVPFFRLLRHYEELAFLREPIVAFQRETQALQSKSFFGLFRYIHFLALAYLVWVAAGENGRRLPMAGVGGRIVTVVRRVGQQSLAVFIASLLLARLLGVVIYEFTEGKAPQDTPLELTIAVNLTGFALIIGVAYLARYFRNPPWTKPSARSAAGAPTAT